MKSRSSSSLDAHSSKVNNILFSIYIHDSKLRSGSFGGFDQVIDMRTGAIYDGEEFHENMWERARSAGGYRR